MKFVTAQESMTLDLLMSNENLRHRIVFYNRLIGYTGVKFDANENQQSYFDDQVVPLMLRINPKVRAGEILLSYELALKGNIDYKLFRECNFTQMNELYKLYKEEETKAFSNEIKNQRLFAQKEIELSEEEKELKLIGFIDEALSIVNQSKQYYMIGVHDAIYDQLKQRGVLKVSKDEAESVWEEAKEFTANKMRSFKATSKSTYEMNKYTRLIESIKIAELGKESAVVDTAKMLILNKYLKVWAFDGLTGKEIIYLK